MPTPLYADRVRETTLTTGTVAVVLAGAATACVAFSTVYVDQDQVNYVITDNVLRFEVGRGTYSAGGNSISRDKVYASSNAGALVNFVAGSKDIWVDVAAVKVDVSGFCPNKILDGEHVIVPDDKDLIYAHRLSLLGTSRVYLLGTSRLRGLL